MVSLEKQSFVKNIKASLKIYNLAKNTWFHKIYNLVKIHSFVKV